MSTQPREPISPELVLVTPGLRAWAIRELSEAETESVLLEPAPPATLPAPAREEAPRWPLPAQFVLYAGWQAITGAVFGFAAFVVFLVLLLLKPLIGG